MEIFLKLMGGSFPIHETWKQGYLYLFILNKIKPREKVLALFLQVFHEYSMVLDKKFFPGTGLLIEHPIHPNKEHSHQFLDYPGVTFTV